jgi:GNAT superfamily N-acetyltransferase
MSPAWNEPIAKLMHRDKQMEIKKCLGKPNFIKMVGLLRSAVPPTLQCKSDEQIVQMFEENFNPETDSIFLLLEGESIMGWYRLSLWPREKADTKEAHLLDIAVESSCQRRGLGKLLLKHCMEECKRRGIETMYSATEESNAPSIGLHKAMGFKMHMKENKTIVWKYFLGSEKDPD